LSCGFVTGARETIRDRIIGWPGSRFSPSVER